MNLENNSPASSSVKFLTGPLSGKTFPLQKSTVIIGRDPSCDIVVFDPKVSRQHARLSGNNGTWSIENLSQKNAMLVNKVNVQQASLQHNSTISLGDDTSFLFLVQASVGAPNQPTPQPSPYPAPIPSTPAPYPPPLLPTQPPYGPMSPRPTAEAAPLPIGMRPTADQIPQPLEERTIAAGQPALEVSSNVHSDKKLHRLFKSVINIGRDTSNEIVINEPVVSGFHAQIVREGGEWVLVHPHPSRGKTLNGLLYQGRAIQGTEQFRKPLKRGDIFRIGDEHGTLVTLSFDDGSGLDQQAPPEIRPIPLGAPIITIGRAPDNMVTLNHPLVSLHHARLEQIQGGYRILDLNSTNHVYINSVQVTNQMLRESDEIRIGPFKMIYTGQMLTQYDESNSIRIDALELQKTGTNNVVLLNGLSLAIPPRKFVALVGGSGAGKSTLMDALNGLRPAQHGTVLYNGQDYYSNLAAFSTSLGYVPQDDIVHRELTVERALYYAARMRLPSDFTKAQIKQRIDEVLEDVEMRERRKLLISKLSGGQRKRVSIALELLANPSVFFLDEPTSGLDPGLDRKMMFLLRRLADRGRTIVLVTHATNNINVCDYICFLCQGGRLAYFGPPNQAKVYFDKTDFAEIYSTLEPTPETPNIPMEAETRFKQSPDYYQYVVQPLQEESVKRSTAHMQQRNKKRVKRGSSFRQFSLLSTRYLELLKNDVGNLLLLLLQAPIVALLLVFIVRSEIGTGIFDANKVVQCRPQILTAAGPVGLLDVKQDQIIDCGRIDDYLRNNTVSGQAYAKDHGGPAKALQDFILPLSGADAQKVLFVMVFSAFMFGALSSVREFIKESAIYRRERAVDLGIIPYMFSKIIVLSVLSLIQSAMLLFIMHIAEPLPAQGILFPMLLEAYITLVLCSMAGMLTGLTISALAPTNDWAISFVPIMLIPQVVFAGALIPLKDLIMQVPAVLFPTRWALVALCTSVGVHSDKAANDKLFNDDFSYHGTLYSIYSHTDAVQRLTLAWIGLGAIVLVFIIVVGISLKSKDIRA